jgi:DNA-binding PadR family transcriptional regulator
MLRHIALSLLKQGPMSGSELTEQINEYTDWRPSPGSMYPLLASLQEEGLIMPYEDETTALKRFTLTDDGAKLVEAYKRGDQEYRNRTRSIYKIYWRLHVEVPEELYESLSGFMDVFETVYTGHRGDPERIVKLKKVLDGAAQELRDLEE